MFKNVLFNLQKIKYQQQNSKIIMLMDTDHGDSILSASVFAHFKTSPLRPPPSPVLPHGLSKFTLRLVFKNLIYPNWSFNIKKSSEICPLSLHTIKFSGKLYLF